MILRKFHFGKRSFGGFGGDTISYHAICDETEKDCYKIEGVIIKGKSIYIYNSGGFIGKQEDIFAIFTQTSMNFYSLNELETLSEEQRNILLDLKERPRFIFE